MENLTTPAARERTANMLVSEGARFDLDASQYFLNSLKSTSPEWSTSISFIIFCTAASVIGFSSAMDSFISSSTPIDPP
jgi:hypothetical protein